MAIKDYYETYWTTEGYAGYNTPRAPHPTLQQLMAAVVTPTSHCLDVACGDGQTCGLWLQEHAAGYVGVDISAPAIEQARARGLDARVIEDVSALPFPDHSFDVATCTEVLEHLFEPQLAVREIYRVLRPGGSLIVTVPNIVYWRRRLEALWGFWNPEGDDLGWDQPWRSPHIRFFTVSSLRRMLTSAGFSPVSVGGHLGSFICDIPYARTLKNRFLRSSLGGNAGVRQIVSRRPNPFYQSLERMLPSLLAWRLHAVATKPSEG